MATWVTYAIVNAPPASTPNEKLRTIIREDTARRAREMNAMGQEVKAISSEVRHLPAESRISQDASALSASDSSFVAAISAIAAEEDPKKLGEIYLNARDKSVLAVAAGRLGKTKDPIALMVLRSSLENPNEAYRLYAFKGAVNFGGKEGDSLCVEAINKMDREQKIEAISYLDLYYRTDSEFRKQVNDNQFPGIRSFHTFPL